MLQTYTHFNIKEMLRDFDIKRKKTRKKKQYQTTVVKIFKLMTKTFSQKNQMLVYYGLHTKGFGK